MLSPSIKQVIFQHCGQNYGNTLNVKMALLLALLMLLFNPCAGKDCCSGGAGLAGPKPD